MMTCSSFYVTVFLIGPLLGVFSIPFEAGGLVRGRTYTYIMKNRLAVSFGGVVDRERKHLGEKASRIRGTWAPERMIDRAFLGRLVFGSSSIGAPGQRINRAFLGRLAFGPCPVRAPGRRIDRAFLGRLAFGTSPIRALGLGRLVRGTELGPMVPTTVTP